MKNNTSLVNMIGGVVLILVVAAGLYYFFHSATAAPTVIPSISTGPSYDFLDTAFENDGVFVKTSLGTQDTSVQVSPPELVESEFGKTDLGSYE